jgi:F-type H+-transporting ATPase subunit epsilon
MAVSKQLRLVLVTPEKTLIDEAVHDLRFPLYDGQMGVFPGRAPLAGRLGYGELRYTELANPSRHHSYFIDGGFVQIKGEVTTILTNRAIPVEQLSRSQAEEQYQQATVRPTHNEVELTVKERDVQRARSMLSLARKSGA